MLAIVWNPNNFRLINAMRKGERYTARRYIDNITSPIFQRLIPAGKRKLVIHADHSRCHTAKVVLDSTISFAMRRQYLSQLLEPEPPFKMADAEFTTTLPLA
jgi:hypothetical protein